MCPTIDDEPFDVPPESRFAAITSKSLAAPAATHLRGLKGRGVSDHKSSPYG